MPIGKRELSMPEDAEEFAADVYELYRAGRVLFPQVATIYETMATDIHNTTGYVNGLFQGVDQGNTALDYYSGTALPAVEPAHRTLMALRDDLQKVFRESSVIVYDTGEALVEIADSYREIDEVERHFLKEMADEPDSGISEQYDQPPLDRPDPPAVGDPYPPPESS